jgi:DnaJ-class molecular chaperone
MIMKVDKSNEAIAETKCPACDGTGFVKVKQSATLGRRVYAPRCPTCDGKGRVVLAND